MDKGRIIPSGLIEDCVLLPVQLTTLIDGETAPEGVGRLVAGKLKRCRALIIGRTKPVTGPYVLFRKWLAELDNNVAGNALRLVSLGQKN